jgi:hypothetical protein
MTQEEKYDLCLVGRDASNSLSQDNPGGVFNGPMSYAPEVSTRISIMAIINETRKGLRTPYVPKRPAMHKRKMGVIEKHTKKESSGMIVRQ